MSESIKTIWLPACKAGALEFFRCHVGVMRIVMNGGLTAKTEERRRTLVSPI
jgi:hypothetical protein